MDRLVTTSTRARSLLSTHRVLRNTYFLFSIVTDTGVFRPYGCSQHVVATACPRIYPDDGGVLRVDVSDLPFGQ